LLLLLFRLYDWLKASTGKREFNVEVYGNFILRDSKSGELSASHGYRNTSDVQLGSGLRDEADFSLPLGDSWDTRYIATSLLNGSATRHFERIFDNSSRSIVGLAQVVLCIDTFSKGGTWIDEHSPSKIYAQSSGGPASRR
jgi:hypothetical protein